MSTPSVVIANAARTAVGSFNGIFGNTPAHELGAAVIKGVLERAGVEAGEVDEVILSAGPVRSRHSRTTSRIRAEL